MVQATSSRTAAGAADAELVRLARSKDEAAARSAFGTLVVRHESTVRSLLRGLTRNPALADDLAQDAFLKAWKSLAALSDPERFGPWLKRIAFREFLHASRRARLEDAHARTLVDDPVSYDDLELSETLRQLLSQCDAEEAELLILIYGFEFSFAEVARHVGTSEGTLKSRLHRIKQRLRQHVENSHVG